MRTTSIVRAFGTRATRDVVLLPSSNGVVGCRDAEVEAWGEDVDKALGRLVGGPALFGVFAEGAETQGSSMLMSDTPALARGGSNSGFVSRERLDSSKAQPVHWTGDGSGRWKRLPGVPDSLSTSRGDAVVASGVSDMSTSQSPSSPIGRPTDPSA